MTRDRVCLVNALMSGMELIIGPIVKYIMQNAQVHKGNMYALVG